MSEYKDGLHLIPEHMRGGVTRYIDGGLPHMGSFLRAVMENNFQEAFGRADDINTAHMKQWAIFIHCYAPTGCHGSPERVKEWIERGGLAGIEAAAKVHAYPPNHPSDGDVKDEKRQTA